MLIVLIRGIVALVRKGRERLSASSGRGER